MTEAYEDGNYLVRVRAQVMSRDDSSGGWVPLGGGGLSNVSVRKRVRVTPTTTTTAATAANTTGATGQAELSQQPKHDYLIFGKRISDQNVVLSCLIKKDFEYNKVMPTFHHWKTGDKKFGLTFQTAADARAFDKGVRTAVEELLDGLTDSCPNPLPKYQKDVGDDEVFMTLDLPMDAGNSRSSSDSSARTQDPGRDHLHRIHYINREKKFQHELPLDPARQQQNKAENYSYVQLTTPPPPHEYIYPSVEDQKPPRGRRDSTSSLKKRSLEMLPPLPSKTKQKKAGGKNVRAHCKHCHEPFCEDENTKGSCEYAPDCIKTGINRITCIPCAQCMLYHCMADAEGDFAAHPCECGSLDENFSKRWLSLALLSLLVPCLWCYPPLKMCHWCGVSCGICGGRHSAY